VTPDGVAAPGTSGESDLAVLLRGLPPRLSDGCYVYTQVRTGLPAGADPVVMVREDEGMTLILAQPEADRLDLGYEFVAWGYESIWQYNDRGDLPGDQDLFNGTYADLRRLAL